MAKLPMPRIEQNMGMMDRIVRAALGGALLANWLTTDEPSPSCRVGGAVGGAFLIYGLTGWDPLLQVFKTSTRPEDAHSVMTKVAQAKNALKDTIVENAPQMKQQVTDTVKKTVSSARKAISKQTEKMPIGTGA